MLGLGNTLTVSNYIEGITQLGIFTGLIVNDEPDDENVIFALAFTDSAIRAGTNFDGVSLGEKLSRTFTATITRLDSSNNPVTGASTTGALFGYKGPGSNPFIYLSDQDQASFNVAQFLSEGSALVDLTTFGDVTDITDNSVDSSNYTASITFTAPGYTTAVINQFGFFVALDTA